MRENLPSARGERAGHAANRERDHLPQSAGIQVPRPARACLALPRHVPAAKIKKRTAIAGERHGAERHGAADAPIGTGIPRWCGIWKIVPVEGAIIHINMLE
jgi:hypothetical protein